MISIRESKKLEELYQVLGQAVNLYINIKDTNGRKLLKEEVLKVILTVNKYMNDIKVASQNINKFFENLSEEISGADRDNEIIRMFSNITREIEKIDVGEATYENMYMEDNIEKYIYLLEDAYKNDLTILMAVYGSLSDGNNFTRKMGGLFQKLGIVNNLSDLAGCSYMALIDNHKVIDEKYSDSEELEGNYSLDGTNIYLRSVGERVKNKVTGASLRIDGFEYRGGYLGLNIVVYDRKNKKLIDSVCFSPLESELKGEHLHSRREMEFIEKNPNVTFFRIDKPEFPKGELTVYEQFISGNCMSISELRYFSMLAYPILQHIPDLDGVKEVLTQPDIYRNIDGRRKFFDKEGKYFNCINGIRLTENQPKEYNRTIYILGGCIELGIGVKDGDTCASLLQNLLNENVKVKNIRVVNCGMGCTGVSRKEELLNTAEGLNLKAGDIVIGLGEKIRPYSKEYEKRPCKYGEVCFDWMHLAKGGMKMYADEMYEALVDNDFFEDMLKHRIEDNKEENVNKWNLKERPEYQRIIQSTGLLKYKAELENLWETQLDRSEDVGAIVMNCNPFTLGHRYLIEQASKQCEYLIIFVVEENKSEFLFEDRIRLVEEGTKDLANVIVRPSGQFIISMETFKGYFNKRELQDRKVDSTNDVLIFANEIAPSAHIKKRFAGSEPMDKVTETYNRNMEEILPEFGIEFVEMPRIEKDSAPISASRVRKLLEDRDFDTIEKLVPKVTFEYLTKKYQ